MQLTNLKLLKNKLKNPRDQLNALLLKHPKTFSLLLGLNVKKSFNQSEQFWWLLLSILTLLHILAKSPKSKAFAIGYMFGFGYFLSTLYWIAEASKCVGMDNLGYIAVLVLVSYLALYTAITCHIARKLESVLAQRIAFATLWTIFEIIRGRLFTGFPWNLIGYASYEIPGFAQIARFVSVYGVTFALLLILSLLTKKTYKYAIMLAFTIMSYGICKVNISPKNLDLGNDFSITVVQPSIPQWKKNNPKYFWDNLDLHISLSKFGTNAKRLIIWPETALENTINPYNPFILKYVASNLGKNEILITGMDRIKDKNLYNSVIALDQTGNILQYYDKRHLVLFGEYIPTWLLQLGLHKITSGMVNFSKGSTTKTFNLKEFSQFDVNICYEIVMPWCIMDSPKTSKWILTISNDAWFGDTDEPYQHMKAACFRAIEENKPVIRCSNNGISCIINSNGQILKKLGTNVVGTISY